MSNQVYLVIRELGTNTEVKRFGPMSEAKAERVERGLVMQMNTDEFYVDEVPESEIDSGTAR